MPGMLLTKVFSRRWIVRSGSLPSPPVCVITKDEDFAQRRALAEARPAIIWVRLPNARRRELLTWFDQALPAIIDALERGETLVEVI